MSILLTEAERNGALKVIFWLFKPCTEHKHNGFSYSQYNTFSGWFFTHRYLCSECMNELRKEATIV